MVSEFGQFASDRRRRPYVYLVRTAATRFMFDRPRSDPFMSGSYLTVSELRGSILQSPDARRFECLEFLTVLCYEDVHSGNYPVLG